MIETASQSRILGLDVARAVAIGGMALIHFTIVLSSNDFDNLLGWLTDRAAGRPATIFMILAGIGVSLQARRSERETRRSERETRRRLWRRGLFFLAAGYLNLLLWSGDILRVYGIAYLAAVFFVGWSGRTLAMAAAGVVILFVLLGVLIDFETNWDFDTLEYANLWTPSGAMLNLFYNGFRAVFPWLSLFLLGMVIGRHNIASRSVQTKLVCLGLLVWGSAELVSLAIRQRLLSFEGVDPDMITAVFGTDSLPAMPLFLLSSSGFAISGIAACVFLADSKPLSRWLAWLASAGQMAFTWYVAHILIVIAAGILTGFRGDIPMIGAWIVSFLFFAAMVIISGCYRRRFRIGPLEWLLRTVAR